VILKRVSEAIRRQDWVAVLLEFLILVVGIFLGLQATSWNEERQRQSSRLETLNLLQDETLANLGRIDRRNRYYEERIAQLTVVVGAVASGQLDPGSNADFERGLAQIQFFAPVAIHDAAFVALQESGAIAELNDKALLIELADYRASVDWIASQHRSFRDGISTLGEYWRPHVEHLRDPRPGVTTVQWQLKAFHEDRVARSAVIEVERMYEIFAGYIRSLGDETLALCEALAARTGRPCEPPNP
jgi:hypothetical protein